MKRRALISLAASYAASLALIWSLGPHAPLRPFMIALLVVIPLVAFINHLYFVTLPQKYLVGRERTKAVADRRRRLLKWIVATPSFLGEEVKFIARYHLFLDARVDNRYDEAIAQGRALLARKSTPGIESDVRRRLADCLELVGRVGEATEERRLAAECLEGAEVDFLERLSYAKSLEAERRYDEAYDVYEQGLGLVEASEIQASAKPKVRAEFMIHLVLTSFHAGRPGDTVRWADRVIALGDPANFVLVAHRMAVVALGNIGDLDQAESHARRVLELVEPGGKADEIVKALAALAGIERKRGKLAEADLSCRKAEAIGANRDLYMNWSETPPAQGRFEEALGRLRQAADSEPLAVPAAERRVQAAIRSSAAMSEADLRRWPEAEANLREAAPEFEADPKLSVSFGAKMARIHAGLGRRAEAIEALETSLGRLDEFPDDRTTQAGVFAQAGFAAHLLGDFEQAERLWAGYLENNPDPVYVPTGQYHRGEALLGLGLIDEARAALAQAVEPRIDSHHARLARKRLDELTPFNRESTRA